MSELRHAGLATLRLLADGQWHTGVAMAKQLGLSRTAIWKQVAALRKLGVQVVADRRRGYRLEYPISLLDADRIRAGLRPPVRAAVDALEVLTVTVSTNLCLSSRPAPPEGRMHVVAADYQTGGRGRRGRRWLSPFGHGICLSVARSFASTPRDLPAMSLVAGLAVAEALSGLGVDGIRLKWPNDVMGGGGKLGGILVEVAGEPGGPLHVVVGIGLNVRPLAGLAAALRAEGGAVPAASLDELAGAGRLDRSDIVASLVNCLHARLEEFETVGWAGAAGGWRDLDYLAGRPVVVTRGNETIAGVSRGIADDGALLVAVDGKLVTIMAGDVTLRPNAGMPDAMASP